MKKIYDCIIIGSGIAGYSAAVSFRNQNESDSLAIITKEEVPLYSPCILPDYISGDVSRDQVFMKHQMNYLSQSIDWIGSTEVAEIDTVNRTIRLKGPLGNFLRYHRLILATGSRPNLLPCLKVDLEGLFTLKWFADAEHIIKYPAREAVVVGSGLIGLEAAVALAANGMEVTLIEAMEQMMPMLLDEEPAMRVRSILERYKIKVLTNTWVTCATGDLRIRGVTTTDKEIPTDMVIAATGMTPNKELAEQAGIRVGSAGGITVDTQMRTSEAGVYACGDCVESPDFLFNEPGLNLFWHVAKILGQVAGINAAGGDRCFKPYPKMASTNIFGIPVYAIGSTKKELLQKGQIAKSVLQEEAEGLMQVVLLENRIVGLQLINHTKNLPFLIPSVHLGQAMENINGCSDKKIFLSPHLYRYGRFGAFARLADSCKGRSD